MLSTEHSQKLTNNPLKNNSRVWLTDFQLGVRDGSVVKSTSCSHKGSGVRSQNPCGAHNHSVLHFQGILCILFWSPLGPGTQWISTNSFRYTHKHTINVKVFQFYHDNKMDSYIILTPNTALHKSHENGKNLWKNEVCIPWFWSAVG